MNQQKPTRREFMKHGSLAAAGIAAATVATSARPVLGANDRINMAVIGIRGRGKDHYRGWTGIKDVEVRTLCDPDENLFTAGCDEVEKLQKKRPKTEFDLRKVFEDKEIDAVSIATPDHWHSLASIWACQAGKHVYVEKPVSHNIWESRKLVETARRYRRVVGAGCRTGASPGFRRP